MVEMIRALDPNTSKLIYIVLDIIAATLAVVAIWRTFRY